MATDINKSREILTDWKGDNYVFGLNVLDKTGEFAKSLGKKALLVVADLGLVWIGRDAAMVRTDCRSVVAHAPLQPGNVAMSVCQIRLQKDGHL